MMLLLKRTRSSAAVSRSCRTGLAAPGTGRPRRSPHDVRRCPARAAGAARIEGVQRPNSARSSRPAGRRPGRADRSILEDPRKVEVPEQEDAEAQGQHHRRGAKPAMQKVAGLRRDVRPAPLHDPLPRAKLSNLGTLSGRVSTVGSSAISSLWDMVGSIGDWRIGKVHYTSLPDRLQQQQQPQHEGGRGPASWEGPRPRVFEIDPPGKVRSGPAPRLISVVEQEVGHGDLTDDPSGKDHRHTFDSSMD